MSPTLFSPPPPLFVSFRTKKTTSEPELELLFSSERTSFWSPDGLVFLFVCFFNAWKDVGHQIPAGQESRVGHVYSSVAAADTAWSPRREVFAHHNEKHFPESSMSELFYQNKLDHKNSHFASSSKTLNLIFIHRGEKFIGFLFLNRVAICGRFSSFSFVTDFFFFIS